MGAAHYLATAPQFQRVMSKMKGYRGYSSPNYPAEYLTPSEDIFTVPPRSYFARVTTITTRSTAATEDIVPERNVIGRGFFVYWPFSERSGFTR